VRRVLLGVLALLAAVALGVRPGSSRRRGISDGDPERVRPAAGAGVAICSSAEPCVHFVAALALVRLNPTSSFAG
jgi:hypothetical protein